MTVTVLFIKLFKVFCVFMFIILTIKLIGVNDEPEDNK